MNLTAWIVLMGLNFVTISNAAIPDFSTDVYQQGSVFGVVLTPPANHHFNLEAPYSASVEAKKISFAAIQKQPTQLILEVNNPLLAATDEVTASVFLCDQAKTYCVKKKKTLMLKSSIVKPLIDHTVAPPVPTATPKSSAAKSKVTSARKDKEGFWENAPAQAFQESARTRKPVMIDFYGIWCPPCNQYNESVFPTAAFQKVAANYVLLKMDADAESSWALKSHFKIGGYPTLLIAKAPTVYTSVTDTKNLEEIDRIVGFFPVAELSKRMNQAYANRNQRFEDRILSLKADYLEGLQKLVETKWEQKDFVSALAFADEGLKILPDDLYFQMVRLQARVRDRVDAVREKPSLDLLSKINEQRKTLAVETLMRAQDLIVSHAEILKPETIALANEILNAVAERANPKTLTLEGYELSIADIDAMKVEVANALKDEAMQKRARGQTIESYQKLIALNGKHESRGLYLEMAYWLWNNNQADEAKKIYDRLIKKYPKEFTFYFASAKMNLELKKYAEAKAQAEKAVEYSYGDNQLRSMERLVRVLTASGEPVIAVEKGNALLARTTDPKGYAIRTDRYIAALKKAVEAAEKDLKNKMTAQ